MKYLFLLFFCATAVFARDVTLEWDPNPEDDIAGYRMQISTNADMTWGSTIDLGNVTRYTVTGLEDVPTYFTVTAYNTAGLESDPSDTVVSYPKNPDLAPPVNLTIAPTETERRFYVTWDYNGPIELVKYFVVSQIDVDGDSYGYNEVYTTGSNAYREAYVDIDIGYNAIMVYAVDLNFFKSPHSDYRMINGGPIETPPSAPKNFRIINVFYAPLAILTEDDQEILTEEGQNIIIE